MSRQGPLIDVTLYVWGDHMDPAVISAHLGIVPSLSRRKGDIRTTRTGHRIMAKTSIWTLTTERKDSGLSVHLRELASRSEGRFSVVGELAGVEGAYVDVYVAVSANDRDGGAYSFRLDTEDVAALQKIGLPVEFTIDVVKE